MSAGERPLPPECARLAATLRELRSATGLSLAALAARTPYSKSSWERYLNGRTLPPRQAVEQLCALAGAQPERPLALWGLAEAAWRGRSEVRDAPRAEGDKSAGEAADEQGVAEPNARSRVPWLLAGLAVLAAGTLFLQSRPDDDTVPAVVPTASTASEAGPGCHGASCTGKGAESLDCSTATRAPVELGEHRYGDTLVKARWSPYCDTVWASLDRGVLGDRVEIVVPGVRVQHRRVETRLEETYRVSTTMAAAREDVLGRVQACLVRRDERRCFTLTPP
ncbi:helix-turn-helix domain-containing protein [Streptomyces justiciae]|uniref:helix-turn-helix domain-containing protein n=1 Tax=Streptomyces justiciae TaxID=2780140 RepID=UPI002243ABE1|nr:XRE family transcriptional regulator [Streptomyces justiciae]MCW8384331.1 helix-turn-helix domain-containing protein [Streptomyces justiciae]